MKREFKGFIYINSKGEYLQRKIDRGYFDSTYYALDYFKDFSLSCLFEDKINVKDNVDLDNWLKYRTLFADDIVNSCECIEVVVICKGLDWEISYV